MSLKSLVALNWFFAGVAAVAMIQSAAAGEWRRLPAIAPVFALNLGVGICALLKRSEP